MFYSENLKLTSSLKKYENFYSLRIKNRKKSQKSAKIRAFSPKRVPFKAETGMLWGWENTEIISWRNFQVSVISHTNFRVRYTLNALKESYKINAISFFFQGGKLI